MRNVLTHKVTSFVSSLSTEGLNQLLQTTSTKLEKPLSFFSKLTEYEVVKVGISSLCHNKYLFIVSEIMIYLTSFEDLLLTVTFIVHSLALVGKTIVSFVFS